jgi:hypothetical protein
MANKTSKVYQAQKLIHVKSLAPHPRNRSYFLNPRSPLLSLFILSSIPQPTHMKVITRCRLQNYLISHLSLMNQTRLVTLMFSPS